jgi:hypothetical protein
MNRERPAAVRRSIAICAAWFAYTLLDALQYRALWIDEFPGLTYLAVLQMLMVRTLAIWIPLTFAFFAVARRVPLTHDLWPRGAIRLAAVLAIALVAQDSLLWLTNHWRPAFYAGWNAPAAPLARHLARSLAGYHFELCVIAFVCYAWTHLRVTHESRLRIAELERSVAGARLDALSAQLQPRFLFDALDLIATLAHRDATAADRALMSLSTLLRFNLASAAHETTVDAEVALATDYFAIERARGDGFDVRWSVDAGCGRALVPALIVQALAEYVLHAHRVALHVAIAARGERLAIEVRAEPVAPHAAHAAPPADVLERLRGLHGGDHVLAAGIDAAGRRTVRVELPLRIAPETRAPGKRAPETRPADA